GGAAIARVALDDQDAFACLPLAEERGDRATDDAAADDDDAPRPIHRPPPWNGYCRAERRICELRRRGDIEIGCLGGAALCRRTAARRGVLALFQLRPGRHL